MLWVQFIKWKMVSCWQLSQGLYGSLREQSTISLQSWRYWRPAPMLHTWLKTASIHALFRKTSVKVTVWWRHQKHICKEQRSNSDVPKADTLLPLSASLCKWCGFVCVIRPWHSPPEVYEVHKLNTEVQKWKYSTTSRNTLSLFHCSKVQSIQPYKY